MNVRILLAAVAVLAVLAHAQENFETKAATRVLNKVRGLHRGVVRGRFKVAGANYTPQTLCNRLIEQRNKDFRDHRNTNAVFDGVSLTAKQCVDAMTAKNVLKQEELEEDLNHWTGWHCGRWWNDLTESQKEVTTGDNRTVFNDPALWYHTKRNSIVPRGIRQEVVWPERTCKHKGHTAAEAQFGFNQLADKFLWGFDPKECGPLETRVFKGSHLGYGFEPDANAHCIVWITPTYAFLECANTATGKKTSSGLAGGHGQWIVQHDRCDTTVVHFPNEKPATTTGAVSDETVSTADMAAATTRVAEETGKGLKVSVFGHASSAGPADVNRFFSRRRAQYVAHHLSLADHLADAPFVPDGCNKVSTGLYACGESFAWKNSDKSRTVELFFH